MNSPIPRSALIGAPVLLMVAEPWDYEGPHGRGRIRGQISDFRNFGPDGGQSLTLSVAGMRCQGAPLERLTAWPLYPGAADILQALCERRAAPVRVYGGENSSVRLRGAIRRLGPGRPDDAPERARP